MVRKNDLREYGRMIVTGGLGFVGSHLVEALTVLGKPVVVLDVGDPGPRRHPRVEYHRTDLRTGLPPLRGGDLVFHVAGNSSGTLSVDRPRFDFETNALATFNVCEALSLAGSGARLVYLSSAMVYGMPRRCPIDESHPVAPFVPYGASKLSGEHVAASFCHAFGLDVVTGRAFTLYGPRENPRLAGGEVSAFLRRHLNRQPIAATGDLDGKTRDFCHVSDLVGALLTIAARGTAGEVYNLGSGTETSLRALAALIGEVTGRAPRLTTDASVTDDTYRMVADIARLRALGFRPRTSLHEGIADLAARLGDRPALPQMDTVFRREQRHVGRARAHDPAQRGRV